ncbi:MAG: hypothetical protein WKF68_02480 [Daejeonella sp.]
MNNPFADQDGGPLPGKEAEFFAWGREHEKKRIANLPKAEQAIANASNRALGERQNS